MANLVPGFNAYVEVLNLNGDKLYQKNVSKEELNNFLKAHSTSKPNWGVLRSAVCPLRTDNIEILAHEITFPILNYALKVNNIVLKTLACIAAIMMDIVTMPIRIVVTPFKMLYDKHNPETPHSLTKLLKIKDEGVFINYCTEDVTMEENHGNQFAKQKEVLGSIFVALKTSYLVRSYKKEKHVTNSYMLDNTTKEWVKVTGPLKHSVKEQSCSC